MKIIWFLIIGKEGGLLKSMEWNAIQDLKLKSQKAYETKKYIKTVSKNGVKMVSTVAITTPFHIVMECNSLNKTKASINMMVHFEKRNKNKPWNYLVLHFRIRQKVIVNGVVEGTLQHAQNVPHFSIAFS